MNNRRLIGAGVIALVLGTPAWAASKGPIQIKPPKTFPVVISQPGSYQLIGNLTVPTAVPAIQIDASNVTLDLNGFTVQAGTASGTLASGINATNTSQRNITVKNGVVHGFNGSGVNLSGSGHVVTDVKAEGNALHGIQVFVGSIVERCTVTGNGLHGITTDTSCAIKDNVCTGNGSDGIHVRQSGTVLQNTCNGNGADGIVTEGGSTAIQNNCSGNAGNGIACVGSNNSIVDNTCLQKEVGGINLGSVGSNYAAQNKLGGNVTAIVNAGGNTLGAGDLANVTF